MDWRTVRLIWLRELRDQLRDRRTLIMILVLPLVLYPVLGLSMLGITQGWLHQRNTVGVYNVAALPQATDQSAGNPGRSAACWLATTPIAPAGPTDWLTSSLAYDRMNRAGLGQDYPPLIIKDPDGETLHFSALYLETSQETEPLRVQDLGELSEEDIAAELRRIEHDPARCSNLLQQLQVDMLLIVPPDFQERLQRDERPTIYVISAGRETSRPLANRMQGLLGRWQNHVKEVRLLRRGLSPRYDESIQLIDPEKEQRGSRAASAIILDLMARLAPFLLVMWSLTGALYPAVDLCAGEKERGTMETLLISPAGREEIVYGKFLAIWVFSAATALLNLLSLGVTVWRFTAAAQDGQFQPWALLWCLVLLLPLSAFFSALCLAIGAYARSTKEGQYYLMPLFLVTLPLVFLSLAVKLDPLYCMVPVTGVALLLQELIAGNRDPVTWLYFVTVVAPMLLYAWLALRWAIYQFQREEVLFSEAERLDLRLWLGSLWRDKPALPTMGQAIFCFGLILVLRWLVPSWNTRPTLLGANLAYLTAVLLPPLVLAFAFTTRPLDGLSLRPASWQFLLMAVALALLLLFPLGELGAFALRQYPRVTDQLREHSPLAQELANLGKHQSAISPMDRLRLMLPYTLALGVIAPLCEELAFRGLIFNGLCRRFRPWTAVLLSSFLFALYHANVFQFIPAFVLGVVLALFTARSRSVLPAIVFHCVHNRMLILIVFAGGVIAPELDVAPALRIFCAGLSLLLALGLVTRLWVRGYRFWQIDETEPGVARTPGD